MSHFSLGIFGEFLSWSILMAVFGWVKLQGPQGTTGDHRSGLQSHHFPARLFKSIQSIERYVDYVDQMNNVHN